MPLVCICTYPSECTIARTLLRTNGVSERCHKSQTIFPFLFDRLSLFHATSFFTLSPPSIIPSPSHFLQCCQGISTCFNPFPTPIFLSGGCFFSFSLPLLFLSLSLSDFLPSLRRERNSTLNGNGVISRITLPSVITPTFLRLSIGRYSCVYYYVYIALLNIFRNYSNSYGFFSKNSTKKKISIKYRINFLCKN